LIPLGIVIVAIAIFAILKATKPIPPVKEVVERTWPVAVQSVHFEDVRPMVNAFGEIRAGREAELRAQVSGSVISVHEDLGDGASVHMGDILVTIDDFDYVATLDERQADLAEAEAKLNELESVLVGEEKLLPGDKRQVGISEREVERQRKLVKRGAVSRKSYDDALTGLNDRKQSVLVREQAITRMKTQIIQAQSSVQKAKTALSKAARDVEDTKLKAPFDGFLSNTDVTEGKQVSTSDRLGRLISLERLEVSFHVSEADYARLTRVNDLTGRSVKVMVRRGSEDAEYKGKINRIDARVDAATGGRKVFATLSGLTLKTDLRPGVFVQVSVPDEIYQGIVSVPYQAVHDNEAVYVVVEGRLVRRKVMIAARNGDQILISNGLEEGENICITRFAEMGEGIKVIVK
jgi:RND family efflux transporter MFP subunit